MELDQLKYDSHQKENIEMNIIVSKGVHIYSVELSRGRHFVGKLVREGRPLIFRSLEGASQTLRMLGFKHANLIEQSEDSADSRTTLKL